ncbi:MAG: endoglucanase [Chloroflexi bacterium]|nr:endoglucanase [Chloroflexota bacterium]
MSRRTRITPLVGTFIAISLLFTAAFQPIPVASAARLNSVNITINAAENRKPISPSIYGLNFAKEAFAGEIDLPIRRWGGNATSRYNWQNNNLNTANDWYFENTSHSNAYDWSQSEDYNDWVGQNIRTQTASLITIPMLGYVAKDDTSCGFSVSKYGAQTSVDDPWRIDCGNGINGDGYITGNDPLDTSVSAGPSFMQAWATDLVNTYGAANSGGVQFYALDNEPELWSDTHRDVHPTHQSYDELLAKTIDYGEAVKAADPNAKLLGYVAFGWSGYWYSRRDMVAAAENGYTYFPDYATHGNMYQVEWYLDQMHEYEQANSIRLLDYLDLHYYPESGVALRTAGDSDLQSLRLRSTRSLWDPAYRDESWIGGDDQLPEQRYVRLIPRMREWVNTYYPGTKLAITEYNFGGLEHINGALAQAEVLGIFGREGLDLATLWNYPNPYYDPLGYINFETLPGAYAFRMYRNYDGNGGKFGETSLSAVSGDPSRLSVFAAERNGDGAMTVIIINKTNETITGNAALENFTPDGLARVFQYSASNLNAIVPQPDLATTPSGFTYNFPANSITLIVVPAYTGTVPYRKNMISIAAQDGWVLESSETSGRGGAMNSSASILNVGDDSANKQYRAVLSFDTTLPVNASIASVTFKFKYAGKTGTLPFSTHGQLLVDLRKGAFSNNASLQFNDFKAGATQSALFSLSKLKVNGWYILTFSPEQFQYINPTGATQVRLRFRRDDNNDFGADFLKIYSGNAGAASRPQLIIEYYVP